MSHSAVIRLIEQHRLPVLTAESLDEWLAQQELGLLFFAGDLDRFPESGDVAVILPELLKHFDGRISGALVETASEKTLQGRFRFDAWPALVLLRRGHYLGTITRIRNWSEFVSELTHLANSESKPIPGFKIPVIAESTDRSH